MSIENITDSHYYTSDTFKDALQDPLNMLYVFRAVYSKNSVDEWKNNNTIQENVALNTPGDPTSGFQNPQIYIPTHIDDDKISMQITRPDIQYNVLKSIAFFYGITKKNTDKFYSDLNTAFSYTFPENKANNFAFVIDAPEHLDYNNYLTLDLSQQNIACKFCSYICGEKVDPEGSYIEYWPTFEEDPLKNVYIISSVQHGHPGINTRINLDNPGNRSYYQLLRYAGYVKSYSETNRNAVGFEINNNDTANGTTNITDKWGKFIPSSGTMADLSLADVNPNFFADDSIHTDFGLIKVI